MTSKQIEKLQIEVENEKKKIRDKQRRIRQLQSQEAQKERDKRTARLCQKAGHEESLFAFAHMDQSQHLDFLLALLELPQVKELITEYHLKTGGTQYTDVYDFGNYLAVKKTEVIADAQKIKQKYMPKES